MFKDNMILWINNVSVVILNLRRCYMRLGRHRLLRWNLRKWFFRGSTIDVGNNENEEDISSHTIGRLEIWVWRSLSFELIEVESEENWIISVSQQLSHLYVIFGNLDRKENSGVLIDDFQQESWNKDI